jgi:hypothetical protein
MKHFTFNTIYLWAKKKSCYLWPPLLVRFRHCEMHPGEYLVKKFTDASPVVTHTLNYRCSSWVIKYVGNQIPKVVWSSSSVWVRIWRATKLQEALRSKYVHFMRLAFKEEFHAHVQTSLGTTFWSSTRKEINSTQMNKKIQTLGRRWFSKVQRPSHIWWMQPKTRDRL